MMPIQASIDILIQLGAVGILIVITVALLLWYSYSQIRAQAEARLKTNAAIETMARLMEQEKRLYADTQLDDEIITLWNKKFSDFADEIANGFNDEPAKLKNEDLLVDFTPARLNEVVGIGDDGELMYADEKPKRKNG